MAEVPDRRARDQIGLIQNSFQDLLSLMVDAIGRIQRDAAKDPEKLGPGDAPLFKYEEIPFQARAIVHKVLQIDALLDEAIDRTVIGKEESEIFDALEKESDAFLAGVESLTQQTQEAEIWMARTVELLDLIAVNTLGFQPGDDAEEESED
jgi:hypothetical protein